MKTRTSNTKTMRILKVPPIGCGYMIVFLISNSVEGNIIGTDSFSFVNF